MKRAGINIVFKLLAAVSVFTLAGQYMKADEPRLENEKKAEIRLLNNSVDFGTISIDSTAVDSVRFVNTGNAPLIIKSAFSNCGCTVPQYPNHPVLPGDTASISIKYKSIDKYGGTFRKIVRIRSNAVTPTVSIYVSGKTVATR